MLDGIGFLIRMESSNALCALGERNEAQSLVLRS